MKHFIFIAFVLTSISLINSCKSKSISEGKSSDSITMSNQEAQADSLNPALEEFAVDERGEAGRAGDDDEDHDPNDDVDHSGDGIIAKRSQYRFLGFSDDHKYAAFIEGLADGSGASARLYVTDVDKNDFVTKAVESKYPGQHVEEALNVAGEKGKQLLLKYKISGDETGTSYYVDDQSNVNIPFGNKIYKLKLIEKSAPDANKYFELQVLTDTDPIILQKETIVPVSRGKVTSYKVAAFYLLEDKVAVFIEYNGPYQTDAGNKTFYKVMQLLVTGTLY